MLNMWGSILGLDLTVNSIVCERHFKPHDLVEPSLLGHDGVHRTFKSLMPFSLPLPVNDGLSASNATPFIQQLETNDVPVLRTYDAKFKRHKSDELLGTKTIKNNVLGM